MSFTATAKPTARRSGTIASKNGRLSRRAEHARCDGLKFAAHAAARSPIGEEAFIAGSSGYPLIGGAAQVVEGRAVLKGRWLDGNMLTWQRWVEGMTRFRDEAMPLLKQAGLRV